MPDVWSFAFDDENEEKIAAHGLTVEQVEEVLGNPHMIIRNRKHRRGAHLIVGKDNGGICIAVPVEPTYHSYVWRPVTAWQCKEQEKMLLRSRQHG
jgi:uncharacterized DUF497 family protein